MIRHAKKLDSLASLEIDRARHLAEVGPQSLRLAANFLNQPLGLDARLSSRESTAANAASIYGRVPSYGRERQSDESLLQTTTIFGFARCRIVLLHKS